MRSVKCPSEKLALNGENLSRGVSTKSLLILSWTSFACSLNNWCTKLEVMPFTPLDGLLAFTNRCSADFSLLVETCLSFRRVRSLAPRPLPPMMCTAPFVLRWKRLLIKGSNQSGMNLALGSSWILLYNKSWHGPVQYRCERNSGEQSTAVLQLSIFGHLEERKWYLWNRAARLLSGEENRFIHQ